MGNCYRSNGKWFIFWLGGLMNDALGERIKENYEHRTRYKLPRRTYTILRLDGKAFHTYTRDLNKPFDMKLIADLDIATGCLFEEIQGVRFAYSQSDEISFLITDFTTENSCAWFDGNIQKICSVASSIFSVNFNKQRASGTAYFDARVFTIPDPIEVANYFVWRAHDCSRNSIQMVARSLYSHKECNNKSCIDLQEMIFQKGINWNDYDPILKQGRLMKRMESIKTSCIPELGSDMSKINISNSMFVIRKPIIFTHSLPQSNFFQFFKKLVDECPRNFSPQH